MTPRIDSRQTETDSAPDTYRSLVTETEEQTTEYGKPANKPRRFSETAITKETRDIQTKVGKLNLDDICEECNNESTDRYRTKLQYGPEKLGKLPVQRTPRKTSDFSSQRVKEYQGKGSVTPRKQTQRLSLPKLS